MMKKDNSARDRFTLSLGGMRTITSFTPMPVIAHDRLRQPGEIFPLRIYHGANLVPGPGH